MIYSYEELISCFKKEKTSRKWESLEAIAVFQ